MFLYSLKETLFLTHFLRYLFLRLILRLPTLFFEIKALHFKLLTELLSQFSSRNKFFAIFKFRVEHHFFVILGKFGNSKVPNIWKNQFLKFLNFFRTFSKLFPNFSKLLDQKTGFFDQET